MIKECGAQPNISQTLLRNLRIPLLIKNNKPDLNTQKRITAHINEISKRVNKLKELHKLAYEKVEKVTAGILVKAFRGGL